MSSISLALDLMLVRQDTNRQTLTYAFLAMYGCDDDTFFFFSSK